MNGRRLHFIGIGGAGMSGLALVAKALGAELSGSDRSDSSYVQRLRAVGVDLTIGHDAANVPDGAEVVVSTAIGDENPELARARELGLKVLHRGDLLAEIAGLKRCLTIAGTHGKTTTASMVAHVLVALGRDPAYLIGGELTTTGTNAAWGTGADIVVEADESDRSFLKLSPDFAAITNVELDHHATYRSQHEVEEAFAEFVSRCARATAWVEAPPVGAQESFGIGAGDLRATDVRLERHGANFSADGVAVQLQVPGRHNVLNALAALATCRAAGIPVEEAAPALNAFRGAKRRFELRGTTASGAEVYDDYAHHPTEVRATLDAARTLGAKRVVAVFQPHLYSRTKMLARDFGKALALADVVVVLDVYPARERAEDYPGVSGLLVARAAADAAGGKRVYWTPAQPDAERLLAGLLGAGDVLITLGAGDVDRLAARLTG